MSAVAFQFARDAMGCGVQFVLPRYIANTFPSEAESYALMRDVVVPQWKKAARKQFDLVLPEGTLRRRCISVVVPDNIYFVYMVGRDMWPILGGTGVTLSFSSLVALALFMVVACHSVDVVRQHVAPLLPERVAVVVAPRDYFSWTL